MRTKRLKSVIAILFVGWFTASSALADNPAPAYHATKYKYDDATGWSEWVLKITSGKLVLRSDNRSIVRFHSTFKFDNFEMYPNWKVMAKGTALNFEVVTYDGKSGRDCGGSTPLDVCFIADVRIDIPIEYLIETACSKGDGLLIALLAKKRMDSSFSVPLIQGFLYKIKHGGDPQLQDVNLCFDDEEKLFDG